MTTPSNELRPPGSDLPLPAYLRAMWAMRHYSTTLAKARVESTNAETSLGKFWLVGEPLMFIAVYGTIFGVVLGADRGVDNFIGFLATGQILFRHSATAMQRAAVSMAAFEGQIQTMAIPRALMPVTSVMTTFWTQVPSFGVMLGIVVLTGEVPSFKWLLLVPLIAGQVVLNVGIGMILARAVAHVRDLSHVLTHIFRTLLYASGVVFPIRQYIEPRANGELFIDLLIILNPIYGYLELGRWMLMDIPPASMGLTVVSTALWSLASAAVGVLWLKRVELRYGFGQIRNAP